MDVTLPAGDAADVQGIGEEELELAVERIPDGLPVNARRFHRDVRDALAGEPITQGQEIPGGRSERVQMVLDGFARHEADARDDGLLVNIKASALGMDDVHGHLRGEVASAWSPRGRKLENALSGRRPVAAVRGARQAPGHITIRARRTSRRPTSVPTPAAHSIPFHASRLRAAGGALQ